jgi:hypothetical protein
MANSLPADLLCHVFAAVGPPSSYEPEPSTVLSFEERLRAEVRAAGLGRPRHRVSWSCTLVSWCCVHITPAPANPRPCRACALVQLVCKHWRAALAAEPGTFTSLTVSSTQPGCGWMPPGPSTAAQLKAAAAAAVARARALAARAPAVALIRLDCDEQLRPEVLAAYKAALEALLARPVSPENLEQQALL